MSMARHLVLLFGVLCGLILRSSAADWDLLSLIKPKNGIQITLKNYCESWRINVELHNTRDFDYVPDECVDYIKKYMTSTQYTVDLQKTIEEIRIYLSTSCCLKKDGTDAWIFDIDETLLSTVPYYKKYGFGGKLNSTSFEEWLSKGKATVLEPSLTLFNQLKGLGVQIILVSSRKECLRFATTANLLDVGYSGWNSIFLRGADDEKNDVHKYKADVRKQLANAGYRIWGILGDQWSSIEGTPAPKRAFKLPNPLYYVA